MSNIATANEPLVRQDGLHEPAVVDEATNPGNGGVIASSTSDKLADGQSRKHAIKLWQRPDKTLQPWPIVRMFLAALLIVTGVLKATHSAELLASGGLLGSPTAIALVVGFEWFAAAFIAIGPAWFAQRFAFVLFSGFAVVAAWAWWTDQDCGCFGPQTPKGVPLLIDMAALLLAAWSVRHERRSAKDAGGAFQSLRASLIAGSVLAALGMVPDPVLQKIRFSCGCSAFGGVTFNTRTLSTVSVNDPACGGSGTGGGGTGGGE